MSDSRLRQAGVRKIASSTNSLVKVFRHALREGITREGWLATEGLLLLREALEAYARSEGNGLPRGGVRTVLLSESAAEKFAALIRELPGHVELAQVPDRLFEQLSQTETPQGVAALVELARPTLDAVLTEGACLLVACGVQDPGNLGTMIRTAQAFGSPALLTLRETVSPFNPKSVRSSAGAIFRIPVFDNLQAGELFPKLRSAGVTIIATDRHSSDSIVRANLRGGVAFLVGREARGLEEELLREASLRLSIPIRSGTDSLNAGVAAAIFLYEAARQRGFKY